MAKIKPLIVPATDKGLATLARLLSKHLGFVSMTGARIYSLDPLTIVEDGDTEESTVENCTSVPSGTGQAAIVLRQGSLRVLVPLI